MKLGSNSYSLQSRLKILKTLCIGLARETVKGRAVDWKKRGARQLPHDSVTVLDVCMQAIGMSPTQCKPLSRKSMSVEEALLKQNARFRIKLVKHLQYLKNCKLLKFMKAASYSFTLCCSKYF